MFSNGANLVARIPNDGLSRKRRCQNLTDLDHIVASEQANLPTPGRPILPLQLRPALPGGVAIVERARPEMLRMLRGHMMGDNRARFRETAENMIVRARRPTTFTQMQLI